MKTAVSTTLLLVLAIAAIGQSAIEAKGDKYLDEFEYQDALYFYQMAHEEQASPRIMRKIAQVYRNIGDLEASADWYARTLERDATNPDDMLFYAEALKSLEQYDEAIIWYKNYLLKRPTDARAKSHVSNPLYYREIRADTLRYEIRKLAVNTQRPAFGVCPHRDGFFFSAASINPDVSADGETGENDPFLDIYTCKQDEDGEFVAVESLRGHINSEFHDGPVTFDAQTGTVLITRNNMKNGRPVRDKKGNVNLKIYSTTEANGKWQKATELPFNSDSHSTGHPSISPDGQRLYIVSNMDGGHGGTDVYVCQRIGENWGTPRNLGPTINTEGDEMFPFEAKDGALYFASTGHAGLGGLDLFVAERKASDWGTPLNMGAPINTRHDDFSLYFDPEDRWGYFTSNREGQGSDDIYHFAKLQLLEQILAGVISIPDQERSLAGEVVLVSVNGETFELELGAQQDFELKVPVGALVEMRMKSDAFEGEPLLTHQVPEAVDDAFVDLGQFAATFKKMETLDPNIALLMADDRFGTLKAEQLASDADLLKDLLRLKEEMDALESDPLLKAEIFAEDLSSLEISGIGDFRKIRVVGRLEQALATDNDLETIALFYPNSNRQDTVTLDEGNGFEFEVLPGEAFALNAAQLDFDWMNPVVEMQVMTRHYVHEVQLGTVTIDPKNRSGSPTATAETHITNAAAKPLSLTGKLRSARPAYDWNNAAFFLESGTSQQQIALNEDRGFSVLVDRDKPISLTVHTRADSTSETLWIHQFEHSADLEDVDLGTLVIVDFDARQLATETVLPPLEGDVLRASREVYAPVATGSDFNIPNIYFDYNEDRIRTADVAPLNELVEILKANPDWFLEIHAYTDARGSEDYNWKLSEQRARSVQRYMALHGVNGHRLMVDWHGESDLISLTAAQHEAGIDEHQLNRRAAFEFVVRR